jgi:hypothetical protein
VRFDGFLEHDYNDFAGRNGSGSAGMHENPPQRGGIFTKGKRHFSISGRASTPRTILPPESLTCTRSPTLQLCIIAGFTSLHAFIVTGVISNFRRHLIELSLCSFEEPRRPDISVWDLRQALTKVLS